MDTLGDRLVFFWPTLIYWHWWLSILFTIAIMVIWKNGFIFLGGGVRLWLSHFNMADVFHDMTPWMASAWKRTMRASDRRGDSPTSRYPLPWWQPWKSFYGTPRKAQVLIDLWWFYVRFSYRFQLLGEYHYAAYGQLSMQAKTHLVCSFNHRPWATK